MNLQTQYQETVTEARSRDYKVGGVSYQRVSTILGVINKPALVGWMKRITLESVSETLQDTNVLTKLADIAAWAVAEIIVLERKEGRDDAGE